VQNRVQIRVARFFGVKTGTNQGCQIFWGKNGYKSGLPDFSAIVAESGTRFEFAARRHSEKIFNLFLLCARAIDRTFK
jgi:hypothetical protein